MRFFFLSILFLPHFCGAQTFPSLDEMSIDVKYAGGQVFKHSPKLNLDAPPYAQEFEIGVSHRTFGKRAWESKNNFPIPSINFAVVDYGSPAFGQSFAFFPAIEYNIIRRKNMACRVKFGGGVAYVNKHWERDDTLNNYVSSDLNNFTLIQLGANYIISKHIELQAGGRLSHISNGTFRQPNFGINNTTAFLGINYYPVGTKLNYTKENNVDRKRQWEFALRTAVSFGEQNIPDGPLAGIYSVSFYANNTFLKKHRWFVGADATYNRRIENGLRYNYYLDGNPFDVSWGSSIFGGAELLYGKVGIPLQIGVYTKKVINFNKLWYQKVGMQYYFYQNNKGFFKNIFASTILKTHTQNADYIEFGLGFMF